MSKVIDRATVQTTEQGLQLRGDLLYSNASNILSDSTIALTKFKEKPTAKTIQIDLSQLNNIDSAGVAVLLAWHRQCHAMNKSCVFIGFNQQAKRLLETYQLQPLLDCS